ncbi:GLPGLI family protein [Olivibacter domesticus]|uniref:GLPGLI family protein n=1 Tax=Olivibacter domesticus TaxID=407022 RepID=A0A1H7JR90_OLID1|nr:GLPGLI family protein [Olivibacter domesticus]SEK76914.1 GLPGLI family protein [Olivibacter domesticus]
MPKILYICAFLTIFVDRLNQAGRSVNYSIQADYHMSYLPDSTNNQIKEEEMELLVNSGESVFRAKKKALTDSIINEGSKGNNNLGLLASNLTQIRYYIYKIGDTIITQDEFKVNPKEKAFYSEPRKFDWHISDDTASIAGLLCQKAKMVYGGREWIAWFAQDIPLDEGPYKFCGLPGLIVKIADSRNHWIFELTALKEIKRSVSIAFNKVDPPRFISKKECFKSKRNYVLNRTKIEEASGFISFKDERSRGLSYKKDKERADKDNNWIELYEAVVK